MKKRNKSHPLALTKPRKEFLRLADGKIVTKTHHDGSWYFSIPDVAKKFSARTVDPLISSGRLIPVGDGLFPECSQTYSVA
jgi:hypothetical protein